MVTNRQRNTVVKKEKTAALTICCPTELSIEVARKRSILGRSNALPILITPKPVFVQSTREKYCRTPNTCRPKPANAGLETYPI